MSTTPRRYDIDWLRVIAIGLLIIYHTAILFQPWGVFIGFIQSDKSLESLWIPMAMLNVWRIPLLFFVSGMGVCFAMSKRNQTKLLLERTRRILLPFLFGIIIIVPLHLFIWQKYYHQDISYSPSPGHLWFLGNIFIYVLLLSPLFFYLKRNENGLINRVLKYLFRRPWGLLLIAASFAIEAEVVNPEIYEMYALTLHGFLSGFLSFFFGFCLVHGGEKSWKEISRRRWPLLSLASVLFGIRLTVFQLKAPNFLMAVESVVWIFAAFGFAHRYLNRPGKALTYLSRAAYPVYILHMIFLYLGSFLILPMDIPLPVKFLLIVIITSVGCFVTYHLIIQRTNWLRPLFGLKGESRFQKFL